MGRVIRFGVSLDDGLLEKFDQLCAERGYQTRSEAIRDLIRNSLVKQEWEDDSKEVAGSLSIIYDHHTSNLAQLLTVIQHDYHHIIVSSMHVHLDHDNCLEILVLKGKAQLLRTFAQKIITTRGVKHGKLNLATTGENLS